MVAILAFIYVAFCIPQNQIQNYFIWDRNSFNMTSFSGILLGTLHRVSLLFLNIKISQEIRIVRIRFSH